MVTSEELEEMPPQANVSCPTPCVPRLGLSRWQPHSRGSQQPASRLSLVCSLLLAHEILTATLGCVFILLMVTHK